MAAMSLEKEIDLPNPPVRGRQRRTEAQAAVSLGEEIRQLRRARGMTLSDLASAIEKTPGFLSQIERGLAKPAVKTLLDISSALNVQVGWFFTDDKADAGRDEEINVVRAAKRRQLRYSELKGSTKLSFEDYLLSPYLNGNMVAGLQRFGPGGTWGDEMIAFESEVFLYILSGSFILKFPNRKYILDEGDSAQFKASELHSGNCPPGETTVLLWVCSPVLLHVTSNSAKRFVPSKGKSRRRRHRAHATSASQDRNRSG
jgi:transcriptional regulator with XRE-family HTH domain